MANSLVARIARSVYMCFNAILRLSAVNWLMFRHTEQHELTHHIFLSNLTSLMKMTSYIFYFPFRFVYGVIIIRDIWFGLRICLDFVKKMHVYHVFITFDLSDQSILRVSIPVLRWLLCWTTHEEKCEDWKTTSERIFIRWQEKHNE